MKKILLIILLSISSLFFFQNTSLCVDEDVKNVLGEVAKNRGGDFFTAKESGGGIRDFLVKVGHDLLIPIFIVIGLLIAFIGFYKLFFTDKEDERKKGLNFFIWGTTGIIIMVSAWFVTTSLVGTEGAFGTLIPTNDKNWDVATIANKIYDTIIHKFFILAMYIIIGVLMIIILISAIRFISHPDNEDIQKKSRTILIWNTIGILTIIYFKYIVGIVYKRTIGGESDLSAGGAILENKDLGWLYTILNYFLGFIAFTITIFIIYQAYLLLTKPDDDNTYKNLKKYFVYSIIGIALVGGVYLIVNFLIVR